MVCGVSDAEFGQRVAAAVTLRADQTRGDGRRLGLEELRRELRGRLAGYKLPTLLRVVEGELAKGQSGKVLKRVLGPRLFPSPGWEGDAEVQVWVSEKAGGLARL
jgi:malonyl-CoA/methylmalonyl-CoA synthetase